MNEVAAEQGAPAGRFEFLDALRGVAATWVVVNHVSNYTPVLNRDLNHYVHTAIIDTGKIGPTTFFVLSGYVMTHALRNVGHTARDARVFVARRWARLSPPYYLAVVFAIIVSSVASRVKDEPYDLPSVGNLIAHAFYVPDLLKLDMVNGVHWTLYLEIQFYLLLWILLKVFWSLRDRGSRLAEVLVGACMVGAAAPPLFGMLNSREAWFGPYVYTFFLGVLLYWGRSRVLPRWVTDLFLVTIGVSWVVQRDVLAGATFVTGCLIRLAESGNRMQTWLSAKPFRVLGAISFSVYLFHSPVMGVVNWAGVKTIGESYAAEVVMIFAYVVASLVVGWLAWWAIERPAIEWSKRIGRPRDRGVVATLPPDSAVA